ncbi:hypothetical protein PMAYCL1PPCAC_30534 [Pristionchus mayeri]|uniref:Uncharacterized protein n=1 Tax=Pristionchus mayeri TaxID=1317129 RepID=A0AAN5DED2_9BILA|nr:hypothetical protein PMAYCL1PPCAC_30534 [Pristionchus mayeri]
MMSFSLVLSFLFLLLAAAVSAADYDSSPSRLSLGAYWPSQSESLRWIDDDDVIEEDKRAPMRMGKRAAFRMGKRAPMRMGKRAPMRMGKRGPLRLGDDME